MILKIIIDKSRLIFGLSILLISFGCAGKITAMQDQSMIANYFGDENNYPELVITDTSKDNIVLNNLPVVAPKDIPVKEEKEKTIAAEITKSPANPALGKYATANRLYLSMVDSMAKVILEYPIQDSMGLPFAENWIGTPNMGLRRPNFVIIHHTAGNNCSDVLQEFTTPGGREASAHYVICKDGTVHHMLNDLLRSHHAGDSKWGNTTDLNSSSIGIELDNNGYQPFTAAQINSLTILLDRLKTAYKIPDANFIGHSDIAPSRKMDPNSRFPWKELSEKGFGLWWNDTSNVVVPENFDYMMALRIVGYDISSPASAIAAFKRHFLQDTKNGMTPAAIKVLFTLYRKFE